MAHTGCKALRLEVKSNNLKEEAATNNLLLVPSSEKKTSPLVLLVKQINLTGKVNGVPTVA